MTIRTQLRAALASLPLALGSVPALAVGGVLATGTLLTGAAPAMAQGYNLQPGDVVQVEVLEDPSLNRSVLILPDGSISFPQAGTIRASGRTVDQVRAALTSALAPNFNAPPTVYVTVSGLATPREREATKQTLPLYVMGEVAAPGLKEALPGTNLLQLLSQAGSLSRFAARNRIELHRVDPQTKASRVYLFDLDQAGGGQGRISGMTSLASGDVIVVPTRRLFE